MPIRYLPRLGILMLLPLVGGCGFIFMHGPPENNQDLPYFTCTESNTGAILDLVWAGLNAVGVVVALVDADAENRGTTIGAGTAWVVFSSFSAKAGFKKTKNCRAAKLQLAERQQESAATTEPWQIQFQFTRTLPDALATSVPRFPVRMTYDTTAAYRN